MDTMNIIINISISLVAGGAAGFGLFTWFGKKWVSSKFNKQLENHKAELTRTTNELQEKLRIEYGTLYKKRARAIEDIYKYLFLFQSFTDKYNKMEYSYDEEGYYKAREFLESMIRVSTELHRFIGMNLIYFSSGDSKKLIDLRTTIFIFISEYNDYLDSDREDVEHKYYQSSPTSFLSDNKYIIASSDVDELLKNILNQFRVLIGIKEEE